MTVRNPAHFNDRRSIAIEIVNPGPLRPDADKPDQLNWWPDNYSTAWCKTTESERYVKAAFRGYRYFATFPAAQTKAVGSLVNQLCSSFEIPRVLPPLNKRNEFDANFFCSFRGIGSHQNFRPDKCDIGPAWDWRGLL